MLKSGVSKLTHTWTLKQKIQVYSWYHNKEQNKVTKIKKCMQILNTGVNILRAMH
jgi:hypothetical protein